MNDIIDKIFVARQPITDRDNKLFAYELLYRSGELNCAEFSDGNSATSHVIFNSFIEIGIENLVADSLAFINIRENIILDEIYKLMFNKKVVLELLEDVSPTADVVEGVKRLKHQGYRIALDDFQYSPEYDDLLPLVDFIKIDVLELGDEDILRELSHLKKYDVKLIAEKVEDLEMYGFCHDLGFDYFQGYYFQKPQLVKHKNIPPNKLVVLNLLRQLSKPDFDFEEMEKSISQDATLTYKLIRYVNSAAFSGRKEISSIKDALSLVGVRVVRQWAQLIIMMQLSEGKPQELLVSALVRARMCELLGELAGNDRDAMFTTGLFSLLDALMDEPIALLLEQLALSSDIKLALLKYEGDKGEILKNTILYEQGDWLELSSSGVDINMHCSCYMDAIKWSDETIHSLLM